MNLKYNIAVIILIALNLKLYPMKENTDNNIGNNYFKYENIPNEIWQYIFNKIACINQNEIQNLLFKSIELRGKNIKIKKI